MAIIHPCIMIADDDPEDAAMLINEFPSQNPTVQVIYVEDGLQALACLRECKPWQLPDVMIIDYEMPPAEYFK